MFIIKATSDPFIPPRKYRVRIRFSGPTLPYPEHKTGLVYVTYPGGYEGVLFLNEKKAARQVFPSFNRHSFRAGFNLDGIVRRGLVLCSSQRPLEDQDDEVVERRGGRRDLLRVRFQTIAAVTSDRFSWFQTNLLNSAPGEFIIMWNTRERLPSTSLARSVFLKTKSRLQAIYPGLSLPTRIHVVPLPNFNRTLVCWGIIYSTIFEMDESLWKKHEMDAVRTRLAMTVSTILISYTLGHTISPRWANDYWFYSGLSAAIAFDSLEDEKEYKKKQWLAHYRLKSFRDKSVLNTVDPNTFDFSSTESIARHAKAFLIFLLYKDALLGRKRFREKIEDVINRYKFTTADSFSATRILTGDSIDQKLYFDSWTNKKDLPVLLAQVSGEGERKTVTVRQAHFRKSENVNDSWTIPINPRWILLNGTVIEVDVNDTLLTGDLNKVTSLGRARVGALFLFYNLAAPASTLYDGTLWSSLFALLDSDNFESVPTVNRASVQQDLGSYVKNGDIGLTTYIAGIRYLWRETSRAVWSSFTYRYRRLQRYLNKDEKAQLKVVIENLVEWTAARKGKKAPQRFDEDIQPFVDQVDCIATGKLKKCPDAFNELDEWHFAVETQPAKRKRLKAWSD
ncbi:aminopeptidase Q-like [Haemaphysalis longicornis]